MAGLIYVDGQISDKAGTMIDTDAQITIKENLCPYVSRGGLKLEKAMELWDFHLEQAVCMDIGASTGGFTDCMLQKGAQKVYAVDVGYGQLDYKLRNDCRVVNMEKQNIRYIDTAAIDPLDFISVDVSFISLKHIFPVAAKMLKDRGKMVCLIKPQFEAGRDKVGKNGVVRDPAVHEEVIEKILAFNAELGFKTLGVVHSPIQGPQGNIEYLYWFTKNPQAEAVAVDVHGLVQQTFADFGKRDDA